MHRSTLFSVVDQGLSSLQNFVLVLLVAHLGGAVEFGAFAIAYLVYTFALQTGQALIGEPFTLQATELDGDTPRRGAVGYAACIGFVLGLPLAATGVALVTSAGGPVGRYLVLMGLALPALLVLDALRQVSFARLSAATALWIDAAWVLASVLAGVGVALLGLRVGPMAVALCWTGTGALVGLVAMVLLDAVPTVTAIRDYAGRTRRLGIRLLGEAVLMNGGQYVVSLAVGLVSGLAALGLLRAAQTLFGPLNTVTSAMRVSALPLLVRSGSFQRLRRNAGRVSALALALAVLWTVPLLLDLGGLGGRLLGGGVWADAHALVLPIGLQYIALGVNLGAFLGLRTTRDTARSSRARLRMTVLIVLGGTVGAVVDGARGAAWLFLFAVLISVGDWHLQFRRSLAHNALPEARTADQDHEPERPAPDRSKVAAPSPA